MVRPGALAIDFGVDEGARSVPFREALRPLISFSSGHCAMCQVAHIRTDDERFKRAKASEGVLDAREHLVDGAGALPVGGLHERRKQRAQLRRPSNIAAHKQVG